MDKDLTHNPKDTGETADILFLTAENHSRYSAKILAWNASHPNQDLKIGFSPDLAPGSEFQKVFIDPEGTIIVSGHKVLEPFKEGENISLPSYSVKFRVKGEIYIDDLLDDITGSAGQEISYWASYSGGRFSHHTDQKTEATNQVERMLNAGTYPNINTNELEKKYKDMIQFAKQSLEQIPQPQA